MGQGFWLLITTRHEGNYSLRLRAGRDKSLT